MIRTLSPSEIRGLNEIQKEYLLRNPFIVSLQPQMLAREALYQSRHGAVTIDQAMDKDKICIKSIKSIDREYDSYSNAEDSFIDQHGISSGLS